MIFGLLDGQGFDASNGIWYHGTKWAGRRCKHRPARWQAWIGGPPMPILPDGSTPTSPDAERKTKRERLAEIVFRLGPDATGPDIREEAYRVGFGMVSGHMLKVVRNEVWPDRDRHSAGPGPEHIARLTAERLAAGLIPCPDCGSARVWSLGHNRRKDGTVNRARVCKDCGLKFRRIEEGPRLPAKQTQLIQAALLTEKTCTRCGRAKPIESFRLRGTSGVIRRPWCKECEAEDAHRHAVRKTLKGFGLTRDQYDQILVDQGGRCAICRTKNPFGPGDMISRKRKRRVFTLDHCHATGKARGLLCSRCNLSIGLFNDDTEILRAAAEYIEHYRRVHSE